LHFLFREGISLRTQSAQCSADADIASVPPLVGGFALDATDLADVPMVDLYMPRNVMHCTLLQARCAPVAALRTNPLPNGLAALHNGRQHDDSEKSDDY